MPVASFSSLCFSPPRMTWKAWERSSERSPDSWLLTEAGLALGDLSVPRRMRLPELRWRVRAPRGGPRAGAAGSRSPVSEAGSLRSREHLPCPHHLRTLRGWPLRSCGVHFPHHLLSPPAEDKSPTKVHSRRPRRPPTPSSHLRLSGVSRHR